MEITTRCRHEHARSVGRERASKHCPDCGAVGELVAHRMLWTAPKSCLSCRHYQAGKHCGLHYRPALERCEDYKAGVIR